MRAIDADALNLSMMLIAPGETKKYCYPCREILKAIEDAPTIEPERKKGMWIEQDDSRDNGMNFCPHCGARMEGDS